MQRCLVADVGHELHVVTFNSGKNCRPRRGPCMYQCGEAVPAVSIDCSGAALQCAWTGAIALVVSDGSLPY